MTVTFKFHGETYNVSRHDVLRVAHTSTPNPIPPTDYYVELEGKRFAPTQLVHLAARTRTCPHSHNSRAILARLGFTAHPPDEETLPSTIHPRQILEGITSTTLGQWRRKLLRILDRLNNRLTSLGPAARISRLTENTRVPRTIAAHMRVVLEHKMPRSMRTRTSRALRRKPYRVPGTPS